MAWHCDPAVVQRGGRRGALSPAEVTQLLEGAEGHQQLRGRFLRLSLAGRIGTGVYGDLLGAVDGAAKDQERHLAPSKPKPLPVEAARFGRNEEAPA